MNGEQFHALIDSHCRASGNRILVIGGRSTYFSREVREDPKFIFWDSIDPDTYNKQRIPRHVTLILFSRFVKHKLDEQVRAMAPPGVRIVPPSAAGIAAFKRYLKRYRRKEVMAMANEPASGTGRSTPAPTPAQDAARDSPAATPASPGGAEPSPGTPSGKPAPAAPEPREVILGHIVDDPGLSELAMQKFLEDCREWKKWAESVPVLAAENERLRQEVEGLRKYRRFLAGLKDLLRETEENST